MPSPDTLPTESESQSRSEYAAGSELLQARMAEVAAQLPAAQQEAFLRAAAGYDAARDLTGQAAVRDMHRQATVETAHDTQTAEYRLDQALEARFRGLAAARIDKQAAAEVAAEYGLAAPPKDVLAEINQKLANNDLEKGAQTFLARFKVRSRDLAQAKLNEKIIVATPDEPTEKDSEAAAGIGIADLDARVAARLDTIEQAVQNLIPGTAGRAVLRSIIGKKGSHIAGAAEVRRAVSLFEEEIILSAGSIGAAPAVKSAVRSYLEAHGLLPLQKENYAAIIEQVVEDMDPLMTAARAKRYIKQQLMTVTVPKLQEAGRFSHLQGAGEDRTRQTFEEWSDEFFRNLLGGQADQEGQEDAGRSAAAGRESSPHEDAVDAEIARLRAEGMDDGHIKKRLLKKYLDPSGGHYDEVSAKIISERFRPVNARTHFHG